MRRLAVPALVALCAGAAAGCGGSSKPVASPSTTTQAMTTTVQQTTTQSANPPLALQAEANSAATGDIPDNQVFLVFHNAKAGWSMKYPEGWAQTGSGSKLAFQDKNDIVRVLVVKGPAPRASAIKAQLENVHIQSGPQQMTISGAPVVKVIYSTRSAPNPVTGKRVTLVVDRYYLAHGAKEAIVDLGTRQ